MQQLSIQYFYPLTEQVALDLDYTPCLKHEEDKRKNSLYVGNRLDQWGVVSIQGDYSVTMNTTMVNPSITIYADKTPILVKSEKKPNILARWVYKIMGVKWEKV